MKRNLLYYIYPRQCSMLALNLYLLCKYQSVFNGRKIVFAVEEDGLVDQLHLSWMLNDTHKIEPYELIMVPNSKNVEVKCLLKMLEMIKSEDPEEISFFAHAKDTDLEILKKHNVTELSNWVIGMYQNNLIDPDKIDEALKKYPCAGTFKCVNSTKLWNYTGNFFWFNHKQLFSRNWKEGIDSSLDEYLSKIFLSNEAYNFNEDYYDKKSSCVVVKNWNTSNVTIVTTCKNRWEFLKKSLPTWLNKGFREIIIVDWSSDDPIYNHIKKLSHGSNPVTIIRVENEEIFNAGMARNTGARHVKTDYILFIDSDMMIKNWELSKYITMLPGRFYHGPHNIPPFGTSLIHINDFKKVNGYTELYRSYGWEDNDLYNRLEENGVQRFLYDERIVEHLEHSDELRAKYRDQQGKKLHETVWENRKIEKWTINHRQEEKPYTRYDLLI